jgi:hypothetical protein
MGTASTKKFIKNVAGTLTEEAALLDTAGVADSGKIPALNSQGVLDASLVNAKATSAGAADAGKIPQLDGSGRLSPTMMPSGFGDDVKSLEASEALSAGDLVNIWNDAGTAKVRKSDGTSSGKEAHGFVLSAVASGASGAVYFEGANTAVTGLTPGIQFLAITAGKTSNTAPSAAGNVVQRVGFAVSATELNFQSNTPIVLA